MAKVNIKPLADRVLVEPMAAETKTASGIIIPDTAKEKEGDTVLYGKYSGTELKLEGTDYLMMRESDILAIV